MDCKRFLFWESVESAFKRSKQFSPLSFKNLKLDPSYKSIHVIGTNGKGSVSLKIAFALERAGYKVGLFTSPHMECVSERIQINRVPIKKEVLQKLRVEIPYERNWYAHLFLIAHAYFMSQKVDFVVYEAGIGARFDPITWVDPLVTVITSLGLDHREILGYTLESIAKEKGALLGKNLVISSGALTPTFLAMCASRDTRIHVAKQDPGDYQASNTFTALKTVEFLTRKKIICRPFNFEDLYSITPPGRFEKIKKEVFLDVAHNPEGLRALQKKIRSCFQKRGILVLGGYNDKDLITPFKESAPVFRAIYVDDDCTRDSRMTPKGELKKGLGYLQDTEVIETTDPIKEAYLRKQEGEPLVISGGFGMVRKGKEWFKDHSGW